MADVNLQITIPDAKVAEMIAMFDFHYDAGSPGFQQENDEDGNFIAAGTLTTLQKKSKLEQAIKRVIGQWYTHYKRESVVVDVSAEIAAFDNAVTTGGG